MVIVALLAVAFPKKMVLLLPLLVMFALLAVLVSLKYR